LERLAGDEQKFAVDKPALKQFFRLAVGVTAA